MKKFASTLMGVALAALTAGAAQAQLAQDSNAPIDITADEAEVINSQCLAIWRGGAEALQARTRLRAEVIRVYSAKDGDSCGATDRLEAEGGVYYVTEGRAVRAASAVYNAGADTITLTGDVIVVEGRNVARGDRAVLNTRTNQIAVTSNARGRGKANRVRGVFYPSSSPSPQQ